MTLKLRLNFLALGLMTLVATAVAVSALVSIHQLVQELNFRFLSTELHQVLDRTRHARQVLFESGLAESSVYTRMAQEELLEAFSRHGPGRDGRLSVLDAQGKVLLHEGRRNGTLVHQTLLQRLADNDLELQHLELPQGARVFVAEEFRPWQWVLAVSLPAEELLRQRNKFLGRTALILGLALLTGGLLFMRLARRIVVPIQELSRTAKAVSQGRWSEPLPRMGARDEVGELTEAFAAMIRKRRQAEEALKTSEARYEALAANFPDGVVGLFDKELRFILLDGAGLGELDLARERIQDRLLHEVLPPPLAEACIPSFRQALAGVSRAFELQHKGREYEVRTLPILDAQGGIQAGMVVAQNVTARKNAERVRAEVERIYTSIAELSPEAIFVHRPAGILLANPAAARLLGKANPAELVGRSLLSLVHGRLKVELQAQFDSAEQRRGPSDLGEFPLQAENGSPVTLEMISVPIVFREQAALLTIGRDISEKQRLMAEAMRSAQLVSLGELAAGVAHEINNPINGIINFAELIRDDPQLRLTYADLPQRIIKEGDRIAGIVHTLLSFARGGSEVQATGSLEEVLQDALRLCQNQLKKDGVEVQVAIQPDLPQFFGKVGELQQVCINCIANARWALNAGNPERKLLRIGMTAHPGPDRALLRIVFEDNGVGIEPDVLQHIFEPFYSTKPRNEGTGLGLFISHRIVQEHKGRIFLESEPGVSTRAVVELPAWEPEHA